MKLTELLYPFAFLPVCLLLYYVLPKRCRNAALLAASLLFFAWGTPEYLVLLVLAILLNYFAGLELESLLEDGKTGHARLVLVLTILADLLPLLFFKYYGEAAAALNRVFVLSLPVHALPAPVGVSFYTFTLLSALSDVYHGRAPMEKNLIRFALFVSFFPKLTSGPIVQYADMQPQLEPHEFVRERVGSGMRLFVIGLAKKVILAGLLGTPFYALKALGPQALSVCGAWLGALLYALMLYFDFSGYSDMAIGAAKMFGFEFLANFDYPYCADSVAAFWRRWHMSLGFWFRTYIYIPLGGNRCKLPRVIFNLFAVWALTGLWHGANFNFIAWGIYYFVILVLEKYVYGKYLEKLPSLLKHIYALFLILLGWTIFYFEDFGQFATYLTSMFTLKNGIIGGDTLSTILMYLPILIVTAMASLPIWKNTYLKLKDKKYMGVLEIAFCAVVIVLCTASLVNQSYNPFLYFRF